MPRTITEEPEYHEDAASITDSARPPRRLNPHYAEEQDAVDQSDELSRDDVSSE